MKHAYLLLVLLLAFGLACTPRGRGGRSGDDDDAADDDDSAGDDDDATGDDDDATGDDDDDDATGSVDGSYTGEMTLNVDQDGALTPLCTNALTVSISGPNLVGQSTCDLFGGFGSIPVALDGDVSGTNVGGFATVDMSALGATAAQGPLDGAIEGNTFAFTFEINDKTIGTMVGSGTADKD